MVRVRGLCFLEVKLLTWLELGTKLMMSHQAKKMSLKIISLFLKQHLVMFLVFYPHQLYQIEVFDDFTRIFQETFYECCWQQFIIWRFKIVQGPSCGVNVTLTL